MSAGHKPGYNPRQAHRGKRAELRRRVASLGLPCAICGRPIDYSLPAGHPMSYELDEIVPLARLPEHMRPRAALDRSNVQPAHRICNERRGARLMNEPKIKAMGGVRGSVDWLKPQKG